MNNLSALKKTEAWVSCVLMGLGHSRAAYGLKDIACEGKIITDGSPEICSKEESLVWDSVRRIYYFMSKAGKVPVVGKYILSVLQNLEAIPAYYPKRNLSKPTWAVKYLNSMISKKGLSTNVLKVFKSKDIPLISTFYTTSLSAEINGIKKDKNYIVICDSDINRVWVPLNPKTSNIKYFAPCQMAYQRLISYGVKKENIYLTGFPLPKENIGDKEEQAILKCDLSQRLQRLDPKGNFFDIYGESVSQFLGKYHGECQNRSTFTLTFAIGGAGAHLDTAEKIIKSLKRKIVINEINLFLSVGINEEIYNKCLNYIKDAGLDYFLGDRIKVIYHKNLWSYFELFNKSLRSTDVLWTKPSELSFYCGLGIPIIISKPIGPHEKNNKKRLLELHAGLVPPGSADYTDQWLFDLRERGRLAESAWDGFLRERKLGAYKIEEIVSGF